MVGRCLRSWMSHGAETRSERASRYQWPRVSWGEHPQLPFNSSILLKTRGTLKASRQRGRVISSKGKGGVRTQDETMAVATDAYLFGYPLVIADHDEAGHDRCRQGRRDDESPANQFVHVRGFP